jgi:hypothetical protein
VDSRRRGLPRSVAGSLLVGAVSQRSVHSKGVPRIVWRYVLNSRCAARAIPHTTRLAVRLVTVGKHQAARSRSNTGQMRAESIS